MIHYTPDQILHPIWKVSLKDMYIFKQGYYDEPEGRDLFGKLVATNKYVFLPSAFWAWADICLGAKVSTFQKMFGRFTYWTGPCLGAATAFTTVTYVLTKARKTDDTWNYIAGAYAAGGVFGAWGRSSQLGWVAGSIFAIAGVVKKLSINEGWSFFPPIETEIGDFRTHKHDFSLYPEGEKGYTTTT